MYKMWIIQNIYSYNVDRNSIICKYHTDCKMNKYFHDYTTQSKKVKEDYSDKKRSPCRRLLLSDYLILILIAESDKDIFQDEQNSQHIHQGADLFLFGFACNYVDDHVRDNSHGDTFRDAVQERHGDDGDKCRDCFCHIVEINLGNRSKHQESYDDQCRSSSEGRDSQEDR